MAVLSGDYRMSGDPVYWCQSCREWSGEPCVSHEKYVTKERPDVAILGMLSEILGALERLEEK